MSKLDFDVPITGWNMVLIGDNIAVSLANSLPYHKGRIILPDSVLTNPFEQEANKRNAINKECHSFVEGISPDLSPRFKDKFSIGDRIIIQGTLTPIMVNGRFIFVVNCNTIVCSLKRADGSPDPEWLARKAHYEEETEKLALKDSKVSTPDTVASHDSF